MKTRHLALALVSTALLAAPGLAQPAPPQGQAGRHTLFPPTDIGLLESPDRDLWQKPEQVMDALKIADGSKVADIGAGGGYFTIRLAHRVGPNGRVWANDVQAFMIEAIKRRLAKDVSKPIRNVQTVLGTNSDPKLPAGTFDAIIMTETFSEIRRNGNPVLFLENVRKALREGGLLGIIDYKPGGGGPGPDEERPTPDQITSTAEEAGLKLVRRDETLLPFQFLLIFTK